MKRKEFEQQARRAAQTAALIQLVAPRLREAVAQLGELAEAVPRAERNGRPRGLARWRHKARRAGQIAALSQLVGLRLREAASDRKVRRAARDTYGTGWRLYEDLRGSDVKQVAGRMARDERLQSELTEFVRSATNTVDAGIASGRRHGRRRLLRLLMITSAAACFVGIVLRQRHEDRP